MSNSSPKAIVIDEKILAYIKSNTLDFSDISAERKENLDKIVDYVLMKTKSNEIAELVYICTHNSRRSHFGQIWGATAAAFYGVTNLKTYSGGTEATACNERSVAAMKRVGFVIEKNYGNKQSNLSYSVCNGWSETNSFFEKVCRSSKSKIWILCGNDLFEC